MRGGSLGSLDEQASDCVWGLAGRLEEGLRDRLVGVYLHGSGALGDFCPAGASDVDLLVVVDDSLDELALRRVTQSLTSAAAACRAPGGLECSVVTAESAASPSPAPRYEVHTNAARVVLGRDRAVDNDLPSYFAICRARGVAVAGPEPADVFGEVDFTWVVQSWLADLRWAETNAPGAYRVLNACRIWRSVADGGFYSKLEGAAWARERVDDVALIDAAVDHQRGRPGPQITAPAAGAFTDAVLKRVHFPA